MVPSSPTIENRIETSREGCCSNIIEMNQKIDIEKRCRSILCKTKITSKEKVLSILESTVVTSFMTISTIYALFSDDVRVLAFDKSVDTAFVVLSSVAFFLFLVEIAIQCWCRERYLQLPDVGKFKSLWNAVTWAERWKYTQAIVTIGSFYFWLDLMATLSMIIEITWLTPFSSGEVMESNLESARAGKASRAGAKAARIIKVVRMIRLVRLVKLYKYFSENKNKKEGSIAPDDDSLDNMPPESHVGAEMSDRTTKKVIVGILIMLMVIPILQVDDLEYNNEFGMRMVFNQRASKDQSSLKAWNFAESYFLNTTRCIDILYKGFDDGQREYKISTPEERLKLESLRHIEMSVITITGENDNHTMTAVFDISRRVDEEALLGIYMTIFVILLLAIGTMTFARDVNNLVIIPIEQMVQLVREISANPLGKHFSLSQDELKGYDDGMETTLLLRTISKIAGLMRVGFGEAGAEIIGKHLNMSSDDNGGSSMGMNILGKGNKILSVFGFCDIRNFTDTTECLQEEVMLFVNRIAHILHSVVVQCGGAANKNIGDAFLLTWKLDPATIGSCEDHEYAGDKALYSFLKTMVEMSRHEDFICNFSPTALGALYERMPGYRCRIGCGLHFGWAVEGAIGSDKKIDASYISPHVNWAEYLESSTKEYGVPILMSEPFFKLLSPEVTKYCRQVDNIKKSKHDDVTALFTYDADLDLVSKEVTREHLVEKENRRKCLTRKKTTGVSLGQSNQLDIDPCKGRKSAFCFASKRLSGIYSNKGRKTETCLAPTDQSDVISNEQRQTNMLLVSSRKFKMVPKQMVSFGKSINVEHILDSETSRVSRSRTHTELDRFFLFVQFLYVRSS